VAKKKHWHELLACREAVLNQAGVAIDTFNLYLHDAKSQHCIATSSVSRSNGSKYFV
jgi:hypothetical protein